MVANWVKELTEEVMGSAPFNIGDIVKHPDGYKVKIIGGSYWGNYGLSNHWSWKRVLDNGTLDTKIEYGYGWQPEGK